jgi:PAS domain S-box-containing protein
MSQDDSPIIKLSAHEQRAEAESLFTSIGDGAISTDEFGRITRVNPAALTLLGYDESELLGEWFPRKIIAVTEKDEPVNLIDRPITKAFLTGKPVVEKTYYRRKDGRQMAVAINASPILLKGRPLGLIEVFRDITFEQEVDRMKSEFISLASHQLRTPLSAIKTYSHMLADGYMGDLSDSQKQTLTHIIAGADRMNALISTLLNITRIESGTIQVTPKLLRIDKLAAEIIKELSVIATDKAISLSMATRGSGSLSVRTDSLIIKEILINLITNGIKYTPDGGEVSLLVRPRRNDVVIEVKDSGWGIPKYDQEQIFSKFFRGQNIIKRETTGTGLGLYLVKGLVEALDGSIWFTSSEQKGTTFYISLPRQRKLSLSDV